MREPCAAHRLDVGVLLRGFGRRDLARDLLQALAVLPRLEAPPEVVRRRALQVLRARRCKTLAARNRLGKLIGGWEQLSCLGSACKTSQ